MRGFVVLLAPRAAAGTPGGPRLGITVSRRVGGAVVRNQLKRRIREWFRAAARTLPGSVDLVVIGRRAAATLSGAEVRQQLECATAQLAGNGR